MGQTNLSDEQIDPQLERQFLASLSRDPSLYRELEPRKDLFAEYSQAFEDLSGAIKADEDVPDVPDDWAPGGNPETLLNELQALWERREGAEAMEVLRDGVYGDRPITDAYDTAVNRLESARGARHAEEAGTLRYPGDLVPDVLDDTQEAREDFQAGGDGITGVRSGIVGLDEILGGFQPGLNIFSGGPGTGENDACPSDRRRCVGKRDARALRHVREHAQTAYAARNCGRRRTRQPRRPKRPRGDE